MSTEKVPIQVWVKPWVREAFRRAAFEQRTSLSKLAGDYLESCCDTDPENPANQQNDAVDDTIPAENARS
jgi:hypothetical protein